MITIIGLIIFGTAVYLFWYRKNQKAKRTPDLVRSKFFPDQLFVGRVCGLDPTLKHVHPSKLFMFPTSYLKCTGFKTFTIDGNELEEVSFDRIDCESYIALHDRFDEKTYFLNLFMTQDYSREESTPIAQDQISLNGVSVAAEEQTDITYKDLSGLISVLVTDNKGSIEERLLRAYSRDATDTDKEYLILMQDKEGVIKFYVGFTLNITQLTTL